MDDTPFRFAWPVAAGYEITRVPAVEPSGLGLEGDYDVIRARGGPLRFCHPLEHPGLWLRFAYSCTTADSALSFAGAFGSLTGSPERLDHILGTASLLRAIAQHLDVGERLAATRLFAASGLPTMKEAVLWFADRPEAFEFRLVPLTLRDALLHQAGEAITGNRRFRRCRNENCPNWFHLGPSTAEGNRRQTITARREFCSDRCRVAAARRQKKEMTAHA